MDYREMAKLASDPARVRATAQFILAVEQHAPSSPMHKFLSDLSGFDGAKPLTTRQLETLHSLREGASRRSKVGRYRAGTLITVAWQNRSELIDDDAEKWLDRLHQRGPDAALSRSEWRRLFAICRRLEIMHGDEWVPLG